MSPDPSTNDFLARVRHDLRTPLNQIIGYSELMIEEAAEQGHASAITDLKKIHAAGRQLLDLMSRLVLAEDMNIDLMRHEIYTPLNHIVGYCEILMEDGAGNPEDSFVADVRKIHSSARRLVDLLQDNKEMIRKLGAPPSRSPSSPLSAVKLISEPPAASAAAIRSGGRILVVDDSEMNRDLLSRRLERQGHRVITAEDGASALRTVGAEQPDLILLDIIMPGMDGFEVLKQLKADRNLRHIPVIMLSALDEVDSVVKCIKLGAEDFLHKPFNPVLLKARIGACLEKKWLRDQEQDALRRLKAEQEKSEQLLLNILPKLIADRLKAGQTVIADHFQEVTVLFADIVGFTPLSDRITPQELVHLLNEIFSTFDHLTEKHGLEKIKTVGDMYMVVGGLPSPRPDHAGAIAELALDMQEQIKRHNSGIGEPFQMRIGIHTGPAVAGVIGTRKFSYDLWGDTVNTASRMETHAEEGTIHVTAATYERLKDRYLFRERGSILVKGKGKMTTFVLVGRKK
jgi:class 3 adenylate cyclase